MQPRIPTHDELRAFKERHGLTVRGFAAQVGVNPATMRDWLSGKHPPSDYSKVTALLKTMRRIERRASRKSP